MKSTVIKIKHDSDNLSDILKETQKTAAYAGIDAKKTLRLRLLAEELTGMLKELSGDYSGEFWLEQEELKFALITDIYVNEVMDNKTKKGFIDVSSSKKNAAAKGIMGKIRDVVENMMYAENAAFSSDGALAQIETAMMLGAEAQCGYTGVVVDNIVDNLMLDSCWSLNAYKDKQRDKEEPWDEIEKSIIANIADDVTVAVKGNHVEIVITKDFE
ncbi:MAG: hypothetical protein IKY52_12450 [Clostridia bacterium]|nr:hypothetical protein [Clostridia bacterium]